MRTIAAISTSPGIGGIGIVRISGQNCFNIVEKIFKPKNYQHIDNINPYTIKYGFIVDSKTKETIDEVLVSYFKSPYSYTTEDTCEINCHGGMNIIRKILNVVLENGAEIAEPGEFTKKAFLNGRIDLSQAEAVIDIINSKSDKESKASLNQLEGALSKKIQDINKELVNLMVDIEASIDYPEYDVEEVTNFKIWNVLESVKSKLYSLINTFENGKIIKEGIKTAIIGRPNVGKSSLLNAILKEERAIVTSEAGTTRDTIEEYINIKGLPLKIIDTAGIRNADNMIEKIGIEKAKKIANEADLVIAIFDSTESLKKEDKEILKFIKNKNCIIILNKNDLAIEIDENEESIKKSNKKVIKISTFNLEGIDKLEEEILNIYNLDKISIENDVIITNLRHKEAIIKAFKNVEKSIEIVKQQLPIDIMAINIKEAMENLGQITGTTVSEDIIQGIFSKFCLGK
jgi:tRNA modification GTPase TrmE